MAQIPPPKITRFDNTFHGFGQELAFDLGEAVWMFAKLESVTFEYLRVLSEDRLDLAMKNVMLDGRLLMVTELVKRSSFNAAPMKDIALAALSDLRALIPQRNMIVHNPWDVWFDAEEVGFRADIDRLPERKKTIARDEIQRFSARCIELHGTLLNALSHCDRYSSVTSP
jgi:hypothetical protein